MRVCSSCCHTCEIACNGQYKDYLVVYLTIVTRANLLRIGSASMIPQSQGCSNPELTEDHVLTSAYVKFFRTVARNAVNKSV